MGITYGPYQHFLKSWIAKLVHGTILFMCNRQCLEVSGLETHGPCKTDQRPTIDSCRCCKQDTLPQTSGPYQEGMQTGSTCHHRSSIYAARLFVIVNVRQLRAAVLSMPDGPCQCECCQCHSIQDLCKGCMQGSPAQAP